VLDIFGDATHVAVWRQSSKRAQSIVIRTRFDSSTGFND
jgi:hypothetical protein